MGRVIGIVMLVLFYGLIVFSQILQYGWYRVMAGIGIMAAVVLWLCIAVWLIIGRTDHG